MATKPMLLNTLSGTQIARALLSGDIGSGAVIFGTIASGAVSSGTIGANSVVSGNLASGSVNGSAIASGTITEDKLDPNIAFEVAEQLVDVDNIIAAENISGGVGIAVNVSGLGVAAGAGVASRMPAIGVAASATASGGSVRTALDGEHFNLYTFAGTDRGKRAFIDLSGNVTVTAPSASGNIVQPIATVLNASGLMLRMDSNTTQILD